MKKEDCIFCKLANGDIPTRTLYEDATFRVIMDASPATKGHALIIPKAHADNLYELSDEIAGKAMILAKKLASIMKEKLSCDGFNLVQNNGTTAGQTVFHFHLHLIPRYVDDAQNILWEPRSFSNEQMDEIKDKIISGM